MIYDNRVIVIPDQVENKNLIAPGSFVVNTLKNSLQYSDDGVIHSTGNSFIKDNKGNLKIVDEDGSGVVIGRMTTGGVTLNTLEFVIVGRPIVNGQQYISYGGEFSLTAEHSFSFEEVLETEEEAQVKDYYWYNEDNGKLLHVGDTFVGTLGTYINKKVHTLKLKVITVLNSGHYSRATNVQVTETNYAEFDISNLELSNFYGVRGTSSREGYFNVTGLESMTEKHSLKVYTFTPNGLIDLNFKDNSITLQSPPLTNDIVDDEVILTVEVTTPSNFVHYKTFKKKI